MRLGLVCTPLNDENLRLAKQISCEDVVYYNMSEMPNTVETLTTVKQQVESHGLRLSVIEGGPRMDKIVAGEEGRDEQIEAYCEAIRNMGIAGIPVLCYNFMHWGCRVGRTSYEVPIRGGALSSAFDMDQWDNSETDPSVPKPSVEETWDNLKYFLDRIIPVAEASKVYLAMHPDDPPIAVLKGFNRIMNTQEDFARLAALCPNVHNGICLDVSLFGLMGFNVADAIRLYRDRLHFVHFRDVEGVRDKYIEVFHDQGMSDHYEIMEALVEIDYQGPIRPDHVPLMEGEEGHHVGEKAEGYFSGKASGYTMMGRLYAVGYLRGLVEAARHGTKKP